MSIIHLQYLLDDKNTMSGVYLREQVDFMGKPAWKHDSDDIVICARDDHWVLVKDRTCAEMGMAFVMSDDANCPTKCKWYFPRRVNSKEWHEIPLRLVFISEEEYQLHLEMLQEKQPKLNDMVLLKEDGNNSFRNGNLREALITYERALSSFEDLASLEKDSADAKALKIDLLSNSAICSFKLNEFNKCIECCNNCLAINDYHVKAYFYRALARDKLLLFSLALQDANHASQLWNSKSGSRSKLDELLVRLKTIDEEDCVILTMSSSDPTAKILANPAAVMPLGDNLMGMDKLMTSIRKPHLSSSELAEICHDSKYAEPESMAGYMVELMNTGDPDLLKTYVSYGKQKGIFTNINMQQRAMHVVKLTNGLRDVLAFMHDPSKFLRVECALRLLKDNNLLDRRFLHLLVSAWDIREFFVSVLSLFRIEDEVTKFISIVTIAALSRWFRSRHWQLLKELGLFPLLIDLLSFSFSGCYQEQRRSSFTNFIHVLFSVVAAGPKMETIVFNELIELGFLDKWLNLLSSEWILRDAKLMDSFLTCMALMSSHVDISVELYHACITNQALQSFMLLSPKASISFRLLSQLPENWAKAPKEKQVLVYKKGSVACLRNLTGDNKIYNKCFADVKKVTDQNNYKVKVRVHNVVITVESENLRGSLCMLDTKQERDQIYQLFAEHGEKCYHPECYKQNPNFMKCSGCNFVLYCSRQCQKGHWKMEHKMECDKLAGWFNDCG